MPRAPVLFDFRSRPHYMGQGTAFAAPRMFTVSWTSVGAELQL